MRRFRFAYVLALFLCVFASSAAIGAAAPPTAQDAPENLIRMADEVAKEVEALRGWKFKHPIKK